MRKYSINIFTIFMIKNIGNTNEYGYFEDFVLDRLCPNSIDMTEM